VAAQDGRATHDVSTQRLIANRTSASTILFVLVHRRDQLCGARKCGTLAHPW
jgi:hypothetical protein